MSTLQLILPKTNTGNLVLVNATHPLADCIPSELVAPDERYPGILMRREAAEALRAALSDIDAGGMIVPVSGYRSMSEQTQIYNDSLRDNGEEFTRKYVALPGCSEHQTGLAIDLGIFSDRIDFIRPDFPYSGICQKFRQVAADYGFVERYSADKQDVTEIAHEPWHFRYVGRPHACIMEQRKLALEEYIAFLKDFCEDRRLVCNTSHGDCYEVFYVPEEAEQEFVRSVQGGSVSGNNDGGFVITIQRS